MCWRSVTTNFIETDGFVYAPGNTRCRQARGSAGLSFGFSDPRDTALMAHSEMLAILADVRVTEKEAK